MGIYNPFNTQKYSRVEKEYLDIKREYSDEMNVPYYPKYKSFYNL